MQIFKSGCTLLSAVAAFGILSCGSAYAKECETTVWTSGADAVPLEALDMLQSYNSWYENVTATDCLLVKKGNLGTARHVLETIDLGGGNKMLLEHTPDHMIARVYPGSTDIYPQKRTNMHELARCSGRDETATCFVYPDAQSMLKIKWSVSRQKPERSELYLQSPLYEKMKAAGATVIMTTRAILQLPDGTTYGGTWSKDNFGYALTHKGDLAVIAALNAAKPGDSLTVQVPVTLKSGEASHVQSNVDTQTFSFANAIGQKLMRKMAVRD